MMAHQDLDSVAQNFEHVRNIVKATISSANRSEDSVKLVVVTKGQPVEKMQALINAGGVLLGENYPEETAEKIPSLTGLEKVKWHMIGHIQSRKIKYLVEYFDFIESVDSLETAHKLDLKFAEADRKVKVLLEVNLSGEQSKQGFDLESTDKWRDFVRDVQSMKRLEHLEIKGLMTMPPLETDLNASRKYFQKCHILGQFINDQLNEHLIAELSMGTSQDYTIAIEEGATIIRVGEAIMGPRTYK